MHRALDFDKTPALGVPLPFFLNVPLFLLLAGVLVCVEGPAAFSSRWGGNALTLTHLLTLGVMGSTMLGALIQILPVACNVPVAQGRFSSLPVYGLFTGGTLALLAGFYWWLPYFLSGGAALLLLAFFVYFVTVGRALWRHRRQVYPGAREILVAVRGALLALAVTVVIGFAMAWALGHGVSLSPLLGHHISWGLAGWAGLLLMGMSFQLVPIFQMTEIYPKWMTRWLPLAVVVLLLAGSSLQSPDGTFNPLLFAVEAALVVAYALWVVATLHLLHTRKRTSHGPTVYFWFTAMYSALAAVIVWVWHTFNPSSQAEVVLGVLILLGVFGSVIIGQLYKIVAFLLWKHAQNTVPVAENDPLEARRYLHLVPKMQAYVRQWPAFMHWGLHLLLMVVWVAAAAGVPLAAWLAGPVLLLAALAFIGNLVFAFVLYRRTLAAIARVKASPPV